MKSNTVALISSIIGWIYVACWSASFYPQAYLNFKRKSVSGLSIDFVVASVIGFLCYSVYTVSFYAIPSIQKEYRDTHDGNDNLVKINDVFFAVHALAVTIIYLIQVLCYRKKDEKMSKLGIGSTITVILITIVLIGLCFANKFSWLTFVYVMSYFKLATTILKYLPQAYLNYQLKSTLGWHIQNVILDFSGGILSIAQLIMDAFNMDDLSGIKGTSAKLMLGLVSIVFDVIFMLQHYVWYKEPVHQRVEVTAGKTSELNSPARSVSAEKASSLNIESGESELESQRNTVDSGVKSP